MDLRQAFRSEKKFLIQLNFNTSLRLSSLTRGILLIRKWEGGEGMNFIISKKKIIRQICLLMIVFLVAGCEQYNIKGKDEANTINIELEKTEESVEDKITEDSIIHEEAKDDKQELEIENVKKDELIQESNDGKQELKIKVYELNSPRIKALKPYATDTGDEVSPSISVPQITPVNDEIKYYNKQMALFAEFLVDNFKVDEKYQVQSTNTASYESYINNEILSVITKHHSQVEGRNEPFMNSINVDLTTGHVIRADEMIKRAGIEDFAQKLDSEMIEELKKFENYLSNGPFQYLKSMILMTNWNQYFQLKSVFEDAYNRHQKEYRPLKPYAIDSQLAATYLDENGELAYILNVNAPAGMGVDQVVFYPKKSQNYEPALNAAYEYYSKNLKIDPKNKDAPIALIAYIGGPLSDEPAEKLNEILINSDLKLTEITKMKANKVREDKGIELYIIIPKNVDTCMYLYTVEAEDREIPIDGTTQMLLLATNSNSSDDILIRIQHRDNLILYKTSQNEEGILKNLPNEIWDITDQFKYTNAEIQDQVKNFIERFILGQD